MGSSPFFGLMPLKTSTSLEVSLLAADAGSMVDVCMLTLNFFPDVNLESEEEKRKRVMKSMCEKKVGTRMCNRHKFIETSQIFVRKLSKFTRFQFF